MANTNAPSGFKPVGHLNGSSWNGQVRKYHVPVGNAAAIGIGTMVGMLATNSDTTGVCNDVVGIDGTTGAGADRPLGPVVSIAHNPEAPRRTYLPAATAGYVFVADSPDLIMEVQSTAALSATNMHYNFGISAESVNTSTGVSTQVIDNPATTATYPLRCIGLVDRPDNALGAYQKVLVKFNTHEFTNMTGVTSGS